jgi:hypothetical protein
MTWLVLIATVTSAELQASMLATMASVGLPTSSWTKDGFWQNLVNWIAFLLQAAYLVLGYTARNAFLETATGPGLTDLANGTYGTPRRTETFATGTITLLNASGSTIDEVAESITCAQLANPTITYKTSAQTYALNGDSVTVGIICDIAGTVGNALAGVTLELTTVLTGVSLTANSAIAGQDAQSDADLRTLAIKQVSSLSGTVTDKIQWFAENTNTDGTIAAQDDGKTRLNINRTSVTNDSVDGTVTAVFASPSGAVDAGEYATLLEVLGQFFLENPGILDDYNATPVPLTIAVAVELRKGSQTDGVATEITTYVTDWFTSSDNGIASDNELFTLDELKGVIFRSRSNIKKVTITTINAAPAADVPLSFAEVATLASFTPTVTVET